MTDTGKPEAVVTQADEEAMLNAANEAFRNVADADSVDWRALKYHFSRHRIAAENRTPTKEASSTVEAGLSLPGVFEMGFDFAFALRGQALEDSRAVGRLLMRDVFAPISDAIDRELKARGFDSFRDSDYGIAQARSIINAALSAVPTPPVTNDSVSQTEGAGTFRSMGDWDERDEAVLLLVDYRDGGEHAIDDATIAVTLGHNNDHNVGEGEGQGWQFAGWCWSHDHYVQGVGQPIGWLPLTEYHQAARRLEDTADVAALATQPTVTPSAQPDPSPQSGEG